LRRLQAKVGIFTFYIRFQDLKRAEITAEWILDNIVRGPIRWDLKFQISNPTFEEPECWLANSLIQGRVQMILPNLERLKNSTP
jgi:hypothetical protein